MLKLFFNIICMKLGSQIWQKASSTNKHQTRGYGHLVKGTKLSYHHTVIVLLVIVLPK